MEWFIMIYAVSIQCVACFVFYIYGQRDGLRTMEKEVEHIAKALVEQHEEIAALRKLTVHSMHDIRTKVFGSMN